MTLKPPKPRELPLLEVTDPDNRLQSLAKAAHEIQNGLIHLGLEYTNKITGKLISADDKILCRLRDSIFFRLGAILFHLELLLAVQADQLYKMNQSLRDPRQLDWLPYGRTDHQIQVFDSIVFHSISFFDYFANYIDFICSHKKQARLKWNGLVRSVRDSSNALSASPVALIVRQLDEQLVDRLYEHRSDLIHYSPDAGGFSATHDIMAAKIDLVVYSPNRITQRFPELKELSTRHRISLNYAAFWLCEKTIKGSQQIVGPVLEHIDRNRRTLPGSEVFFFGKGRKPTNA